ncbi:hypothetical protein GCM10010495_54810 [Kitasatospora herbaricolor]|nr:hypothetical protein GCM10010495_54810 [Kitasatospora herbaricolor]
MWEEPFPLHTLPDASISNGHARRPGPPGGDGPGVAGAGAAEGPRGPVGAGTIDPPGRCAPTRSGC